MNILIADDDLVIRQILKCTLKDEGHQVSVAKDGLEAWSLFEKGAVDLIVSDLLMPHMDGLELCRRLRKAELARYVYFILLTAVDGKAGYLAGMAAGADDFIVKPFDKEMLIARLAVAERILGLQLQVSQLAELLPICSICKKVRDDHNYWHQVEAYIARRTDTRFTHSFCPECFNKLRSELDFRKAAIPNRERA